METATSQQFSSARTPPISPQKEGAGRQHMNMFSYREHEKLTCLIRYRVEKRHVILIAITISKCMKIEQTIHHSTAVLYRLWGDDDDLMKMSVPSFVHPS